MSKKDFYSILGVDKAASQAEIKKAYRQKAMQFHPDRNPGDKAAEAKFKEVAEAYGVLSDEQKKSQYDQLGHDSYSQYTSGGGGRSGNGGMDDIFSGFQDIFSMFGGGQRRAKKKASISPLRGQDLSMEFSISLKEAFLGIKKDITIYRYISCDDCSGKGSEGPMKVLECAYCKGYGQVTIDQGFLAVTQPCPKCSGQGVKLANPCKACKAACRLHRSETISVNIPNNVFDGADLRLTGKGDAGMFGGEAGDLYLRIRISKHPKFARENDDLVTSLSLDYPLLVLGAEIEVENIDGSIEKMHIPAGSGIGKRVVIDGKGFARAGKKSRGNLVVELGCKIPGKISEKTATLLKDLAEELGCKSTLSNKEKGSFSGWFF